MSAPSNCSGGGSRQGISTLFWQELATVALAWYLVDNIPLARMEVTAAAAACLHVECGAFFCVFVFDRLARGWVWHISSSGKLVEDNGKYAPSITFRKDGSSSKVVRATDN